MSDRIRDLANELTRLFALADLLLWFVLLSLCVAIAGGIVGTWLGLWDL